LLFITAEENRLGQQKKIGPIKKIWASDIENGHDGLRFKKMDLWNKKICGGEKKNAL
jgi:hypothetical protein